MTAADKAAATLAKPGTRRERWRARRSRTLTALTLASVGSAMGYWSWLTFTNPGGAGPYLNLLLRGTTAAALCTLALLGLRAALKHTSKGPAAPEPAKWATEPELVAAFRSAGIFPPPRPGQPAQWLSRRGQPLTNGHGHGVTIKLPPGMVAADVTKKRDRLASVLGVPPSQLILTIPDGAPAGVIRIWVVNPVAAAGPRTAYVAARTQTDWHDGPRVGATPAGNTVTALTFEHNTLVAGVMGYGKTSAARVLVAHALLDPTCRVWVIDGKGSKRDWGAAKPCVEQLILGSQEDALTDVEAVLTTVLNIIRDRHAQSDQHPQDHRYGGLVLVLDEWQEIRSAADATNGKTIDSLLDRIMRMGRAVGGHVIISTQRPSVLDVPSSARNLISQRVALVTRNAADAALVLGETPTLPLPSKRGEALLATPAGTVTVQLDYLPDDAWRAVCNRAAALRTTPATTPPDTPPVPPLLAAARDALTASDDGRLTPTGLMMALPLTVRPANAKRLGDEMRRLGAPAGTLHRGRFYLLADVTSAIADASRPVAHPSRDP